VVLYHPKCKASQKVLSLVNNNENVNLVDITTIRKIPEGVDKVPVGIFDSQLISGKPLFEKIDSIINGPSYVNIKGSSNIAGFLNNNSNFSMNNVFSSLGNGADGFTGVPTFDESSVKTLDTLKQERN
jgi:hypothetical protein